MASFAFFQNSGGFTGLSCDKAGAVIAGAGFGDSSIWVSVQKALLFSILFLKNTKFPSHFVILSLFHFLESVWFIKSLLKGV